MTVSLDHPVSYQLNRELGPSIRSPNQKGEIVHEKNMLRIAWNAKNMYINLFSFLGIPTFGEGAGGVDLVGTKSQLNPKILSEGSS